jgi:Cadherin-like domain
MPASTTTPTTFGFTGSLVTYTVPSTGLYAIVATGAQGGDGGGGGSFDSGTNQTFNLAIAGSNGLVTIIEIAQQPVVVNESGFSTQYGTPITLIPAQLLAGDTDPEGGTLAVTAVSGSGAVLNQDGSVTYTPPSQFVSGNAASFGFTVTDTVGLSSAATATIRLTTPPAQITPAQLKLIGTDILTFYRDELLHRPTAADSSKLASDFSSLKLSDNQLGQLLTQALTATVGTSAAGTLGADIAIEFYPKISNDIAHSGTGLAVDLTNMLGTTVAAGLDYLSQIHQGASASQALAGTLNDTSSCRRWPACLVGGPALGRHGAGDGLV